MLTFVLVSCFDGYRSFNSFLPILSNILPVCVPCMSNVIATNLFILIESSIFEMLNVVVCPIEHRLAMRSQLYATNTDVEHSLSRSFTWCNFPIWCSWKHVPVRSFLLVFDYFPLRKKTLSYSLTSLRNGEGCKSVTATLSIRLTCSSSSCHTRAAKLSSESCLVVIVRWNDFNFLRVLSACICVQCSC